VPGEGISEVMVINESLTGKLDVRASEVRPNWGFSGLQKVVLGGHSGFQK
jgi:hypothetical protein